MGCDIHLVVERQKKNGKWVTVAIADWPILSRDKEGMRVYPAARSRNYERFAALAGVRGDGPEPKGLPEDASQTAKFLFRKHESDHHSASWNTLGEAAQIFASTGNPSLNLRDPGEYYFGIDEYEAKEAPHRIVYWFDN